MIILNKTIRNDIKSGVQNFEYLINIDNQVFVATRKQMLKSIPKTELAVGLIDAKANEIYFEDAGMRISDLSEKIDLKTKKPQLANVNITFANFEIITPKVKGGVGRFSDQFSNLLGKEIKIYFKTQSCKSLLECLLVSQLKITRINHDHKQIKITANDLSIDSTLSEIPSNERVLVKGINTFDHYSLKPVPTLYGHLESAPAVVYKEEGDDSFEIKLLPDTSYFDGSEIGGIARFNTDGTQSTLLDSQRDLIQNNKLQLVRQNVVKIGLGDHICDIPCLPYQQTRSAIVDNDETISHNQSQWFSNGDHILFNKGVIVNSHDIVENSTLWCSLNEKPIAVETISYGFVNRFGMWFYGTFDETEFNETKTMMLENQYTPPNDVYPRYTFGVQKFKFKPFSGYTLDDRKDVNDDDKIDVKHDVHFVGNLKLKQFNEYTYYGYHRSTNIYSLFSSPEHDIDATGEQTDFFNWDAVHTKGVGFPSSVADEFTGDYNLDFEGLDLRVRRASLKARGTQDTNQTNWTDYRSSFLSQNLEHTQYNSFVSRYHVNFGQSTYPTVDASVLSLYYFVDDGGAGGYFDSAPKVHTSIEASWRDLEMRKVWSNKNIFEKDFFVNAKGKLGDVEPNVKNISGHMVIKYEGTDPAYGNNAEGADNLHFTELYKLLTNSEYKTKTISGEVYELVLASQDPNNLDSWCYIYDIQIEDLIFREGNLPYLGIDGDNRFIFNYLSDDEADWSMFNNLIYEVNHDTGWVVKFNAKVLGENRITYDNGRNAVDGVRLVYAKKIYENENLIDMEKTDDSNAEELKAYNDNNGYFFQNGYADFTPQGLTFVSWDGDSASNKLIERPHEIIQHLLSNQNLSTKFDNDKINTIYEQTPEYKMAFSINERENTNDIIKKICQQSPIYYRYRGRDKKIVVDMMKSTYSDIDLNGIIDVQKLTNFSFDKTKIEDSCMGGVIVNYGYNYSTKNYDKRTSKRDSSTFREEYKEYYGVEDLSSYETEIDAPYIQDNATAELFRDYYFELNKQQKLTCSFELPISEGIGYEVGDIIKFSENPNKTKPYGRDITLNYKNIDQEVLQYFFITSVQKSLFRTKIKCVQTHELAYRLPPVTLLGDINLSGEIEPEFYEGSDLWHLYNMVSEGLDGYTSQQIANADINGDGEIDTYDILQFLNIYLEE